MKLTHRDFGVMRLSLIILGIALCFSLLLIYFSQSRAEREDKEWHDALRQLQSAQSEFNNAQLDESNMVSYLDEYAASVDQHLIGEETRLDWVENLEKLHQQKIVEDFRYNIGPQTAYVTQPPIDSGNFNINYSEMKLQFDLLHEEQLIDFFDALRSQIKGWYQLDSCSLHRNETEGGVGAQLKAECDGGWVTLKNRNAQP